MDSRYTHYDKRSLPRQKRRIKLPGAKNYGGVEADQTDKFYKCWNCGFVCKVGRDQLGDGVGYCVTDTVETSDYNPQEQGLLDIKGFDMSPDDMSTVLMMKLDSQDNPVTVTHNFTQVVTSGCPLCGSRNYK
jgi:hypothetical protein